MSHVITHRFQLTPFELASYDPNLSAGANLTFAGTHLINGKPVNGSSCARGFDQVGFIMGSSASLFNVRYFSRPRAAFG
jgi:lysophospholipase